jgi:glutathione S-transferase
LAAADPRPLLWHLPISHYSEKVRWALEYKRIAHRRRLVPPGLHPLWAVALTRGMNFTMPVLDVSGSRVVDSTAIVAALEEHFPDRPLYPAGAAERQRALELEEWFDEHLGPPARSLVFEELMSERESLLELAAKQIEWAPAVPAAAFTPAVRGFVRVRYGVGPATEAGRAHEAVRAAFDRLEAELGEGSGRFLVGDAFSVADLTAAALFYPVVMPREGPWQVNALPASLESFRASLAERPGWRWVEEMFRTWRRPG